VSRRSRGGGTIATAALLLAGCGPTAATPRPTPRPTASAPATPVVSPAATGLSVPVPPPAAVYVVPRTGAANPTAAVTELLPSARNSPCYPPGGARYDASRGCPVTARLQARLQANPAGPGAGADPVCRCQNANPNAAAAAAAGGATGATVTVDFGFPGSPNVVRFTVLATAGGWLVDETDCGDASTSIYNTPLRACFS
jgi:hypothetical protein